MHPNPSMPKMCVSHLPLPTGENGRPNAILSRSPLCSAMSDLITQHCAAREGRSAIARSSESGQPVARKNLRNWRAWSRTADAHPHTSQNAVAQAIQSEDRRRTVIGCVICHPRASRSAGRARQASQSFYILAGDGRARAPADAAIAIAIAVASAASRYQID
jgi:hypothetical protein